MNTQNERERIINQLQKTTSENEPFFKSDLEAIADWHLAEVKRIVEPLLKALKKADNEDCAFGQCDIYEEAIDETLKRANGGE